MNRHTLTSAPSLFQEVGKECELCRQMLETFADKKHAPQWEEKDNLPMANFVAGILNENAIRQRALQTDMMLRVLKDTLLHCIQKYEGKMGFQMKRRKADLKKIEEKRQWSTHKCQTAWRTEIRERESRRIRELKDQYYQNKKKGAGFFDMEFNRWEEEAKKGKKEQGEFQALWQSLLNEEEDDIKREIQLEERTFMNSMGDSMHQLVKNNLENASAYLKKNEVTDDLFSQVWPLMGGRWNDVEFERMRKVAHLQRQYPKLNEVAELMGRKAHTEGKRHIRTSSGSTDRMEHASHADIVGVSMGNELSLLMPMELVQFADPEMENLFFEKYVGHRLQTFEHESLSLNPSRSLHKQNAVNRGPMIVCVDQSGSMTGEAERMAMSLMMRLCEMCEEQNRKCFLIAFSVQARPIEVSKDRALLLDFFNTPASGNTDARHMMDMTFELLNGSSVYTGADVLWITDFRIPLPPYSYLKEMERTRKEDCRWNGLQLGIAANKWVMHFDNMVQIEKIKGGMW